MFLITLYGLHFPPLLHFFPPFFSEEAINELLNMEKVGSIWGRMSPPFSHHHHHVLQSSNRQFFYINKMCDHVEIAVCSRLNRLMLFSYNS